MPLAAGTRFGPYEILAPIGAGGMGEVYKARDTRLDRTVAVKVLPPHIAAREDLRQRFEREARAVSSLNHPHICVLHDIGAQDGVDYMVMEHLEGETLSDRLKRGPAPLEQTLSWAAQIADALDRAHRGGVVHRDLKPGNLMLTRDGVKVLDFGLAKTASRQEADGATLTMALTSEGTVLGTPQYMAPEQIEGIEADERSDVFSFGCVLYEMVTGRRAFDGKTKGSVIGAILAADPPPMKTLQPVTPAALERIVRRCLAKDPEERYQSIRDALLDLRSAGEASPAPEAAGKKRRWLWPAAAALAGAVVASLAWVARMPEPPAGIQFAVNPPPGTQFISAGTNVGNSAISPDGTMLAFSARTSRQVQIWVRRLDSIESRALAGTEGGYNPFWSPDSRQIGFFADGRLKKIDAAGGPAQTLCDARPGRGGTWNADGVILYAGSINESAARRAILRVPAAGGTPVPVTTLESAENAHYWPSFLPDGRHFLYVARHADAGKNAIWVAPLDSPGKRKRLVGVLSNAVYAGPPAGSLLQRSPGHLLYARERALLAQPFDPGSLELKGEVFPIAENISYAPNIGFADFSVSSNGVLAYGTGSSDLLRPVWRDRSGKQTGVLWDSSKDPLYPWFRFSPDGTRALYFRLDASGGDLWVADTVRGTESRLTFDSGPAGQRAAVWCGDRIVYRLGNNILHRAADGSGETEVLLSGYDGLPIDCSSDGRRLLLQTFDSRTLSDLAVLDRDGRQEPVTYLASPSSEAGGRFSPDGRWIAYTSDETGYYHVYVQPYVAGKPAGSGRWQISRESGRTPAWRGDGKELYYVTASAEIVAVPVQAEGDRLRVGTPVTLYQAGPISISNFAFEVTRDGQRFLQAEAAANSETSAMTVIWNWQSWRKR